MDNITQRSFRLNLVILRLLGLYPRKEHSMLYLVYGFVLLTCCLLPDPILSSLFYLKDEELSLMDGGFNLVAIIALLSYFPKLIPFITYNKSIRECLYYLESSTYVPLNERRKIIVEDSVWVCKRNTMFIFWCMLLDGISWNCRPLLLSKREFSVDVWLPFDTSTNDFLFYTAYFFVAMGIMYTALICGAVDPLITGLAYLAAGQIKVLKDNLEFLHEDLDADSELIYERIQMCIQQHYTIIRYVNMIEDCFSWSILFQFIGSTGIICFCCLELINLEVQSLNYALFAIYALSLTLQIYFYCYYGTAVYEESKTLATAAYMGPWYEYDLKSQRALLIFMERAKIPMNVTVGKVFYLNLDSFTQILKKSYSLLAVMQNYQ